MREILESHVSDAVTPVIATVVVGAEHPATVFVTKPPARRLIEGAVTSLKLKVWNTGPAVLPHESLAVQVLKMLDLHC